MEKLGRVAPSFYEDPAYWEDSHDWEDDILDEEECDETETDDI